MRLLAILLLVAATLQGCSEAGNNDKSLSKILMQLDSTSPESDRDKAVESLRHLGTNAFPLLVAEMNSFKWQTPQEKDERIISRTQRLRTAFDVFGTNLAPLTQEFVANLDTNRNFVSALDGLAAMRERGAVHLVEAMTNREPPVRFNAVITIIEVGSPEFNPFAQRPV
jgi:hypothetical protein